MSHSSQILKFKVSVTTPPAIVYQAFTQRLGLCEWLCDQAYIDRLGNGNFYLGWNNGYFVSGTFLKLKPFESVAFTWHGRGEPASSKVRVKIREQKGEESGEQTGKTIISLSHHLPTNNVDVKKTAKEFQKGWEKALANLKSILESGEDLRITQRPMLGFSGLREITASDTEFAVPNGILITAVIENMGASQAGLQPGDILVKADGVSLITMGDLRSVVQKHVAGETIKISFYRGKEKIRGNLTLSHMAIPPLAETIEELALKLEKDHRSALKSLQKLLSGVTAEEASFRPKPGEWNILEILAHLLTGERAIHTWVNGLVTGQGTMEIPFYYANNLSMDAVLQAYTTHRTLYIELKRHIMETIQMLRSLPTEVAERKSLTWRMAINLSFIPDHTREHLKQIEDLLSSVRSAEPAAEEISV